MENVVIFYDHLKYFTAIWYNLWLFGIVCGHLVFFSFWYVCTKKNLATLASDSKNLP
jgi:phosphotransferase system  glucose/maltose/N-acetylglucosamine-specific IIC component